jgi:hypothetical protein
MIFRLGNCLPVKHGILEQWLTGMSRNRCQLLDLLGVKYFSRTSRLDRISK